MTRPMTPYGYCTLQDAVASCAGVWGLDDLAQTWEKLRPLLQANIIASGVQNAKYELVSEPSFWAADYNKDAWFSGQMGRSYIGEDPFMRDAFVHIDDLEKFLEKKSKIAVESTARQKSLLKGRSPKAGHDAFWIEACRLIYTAEFLIEERPQAELVDRLLDWSNDNMGSNPYARDTIEDKVKSLCKAIKRRV